VDWHTQGYKKLKLDTVDYEVETPGRRQKRKIYHVNLMKKWYVMSCHLNPVSVASPRNRRHSALAGDHSSSLWVNSTIPEPLKGLLYQFHRY